MAFLYGFITCFVVAGCGFIFAIASTNWDTLGVVVNSFTVVDVIIGVLLGVVISMLGGLISSMIFD